MSQIRLCRRLAMAAVASTWLAGCAAPLLPADAVDPAKTPPVVDISFEQDATHRLLVRYQAPAGVTHLDFLLHDDRIDRVFRTPFMKPANDCGALAPGGLVLRHGKGCERGALFVVEPRVMGLDAMYEPAQPSSDGGVLFYTGYYAAAAPGLATRWRFTPSAGDYVIDDSRRHDASWQVAPGLVFVEAKTPRDQRDSDDWLIAQHAQQYVFLGHTPMTQTGGLLWVHDPALPQAIVDTVGRAGPIAWGAYARAAGRAPDGQTAIVMLSAAGDGHFGYHGDRTEGHMLRLSFAQSASVPDARNLEQWSKFVAHETAHLWNRGVFTTDGDRPWIHEGDAEWAALISMHAAHLLSDRSFVDELQSRIDSCVLVRGDKAAAALPKGRSEDDPYGCGVALQLLGYARLQARRPGLDPLAAWGALHRAHPVLDAAGFAQFFDAAAAPDMGKLLLDDKTAFAPTYRDDLAAVLVLREGRRRARGAGRARAGGRQRDVAHRPGGLRSPGLWTFMDKGEFVLDTNMHCKSLPDGAHLTTIAGIPVTAQPRAAWRALQRVCGGAASVAVGFNGHSDVALACPKPAPDLPPQIVLPDDVLARLGLATASSASN